MDYRESKVDNSKFQRNYKIAIFTSLLIAAEGILMTIVNICGNFTFLAFSTAAYSLLMLISFAHVFYTKKLFLFYINSFIVVFYLEITFLITGGAEGFGILWISLIPLIGMYCLDFKPFTILVSCLYVITLISLYTPLNVYMYQFTPTFKTRYTIFFLVDTLFTSYIKYRITKTEDDLTHQKNILSRELNQAGLIQSTFYKHKKYDFTDWNIGYKNVPMAVVTGDLFDFCTTEDRIDGFGLYDISGHGISSGLLTMLLKNIVHQEFYYDETCELWETVNRINDKFVEEKEEVSNYTTGIITRLKGNQIEFVNAAHPSPLIYRKNKDTIDFIPNDPKSLGPIGLQGFPAIYNSIFVTLEPGDEFIIYTDGLTDCKNKNGEQFTEYNLQNAVLKHINEDVQTQADKIIEEIVSFRGNEIQADDYTIIVVQKK